jgi:hypothetical protein
MGCVMIFSCQKELDPLGYNTCLPETIEVFENNATTASERYSYVYDPVTLWPKTITITLPAISFTKTLDLSLNGNLINLGTTGFIELDASRRIIHLSVNEIYPGAEKGDYFYGYDSQGFLAERLYDDGDSLIERSIFSNTGAAIDSFVIAYEFEPEKLIGSIAYQTAGTTGSGENLLPYTDIFPELIPFSYLVKLGRFSLDIPATMKVLYESPGLPAVPLNFQYSDYRFDGAKLLTGFTSHLTVPGFPDYRRTFSVNYVCN